MTQNRNSESSNILFIFLFIAYFEKRDGFVPGHPGHLSNSQ